MPPGMTRGIDRDSLRTGLCVLVAGVWASSIVASFISRTYEPDPAINGVFSGMLFLLLNPWGGKDKNNGGDS